MAGTLHIVTPSPFATSALDDCLAVAATGDSVILVCDGVYALTKGSAPETLVAEAVTRGTDVYALSDDLAARGLREPITDVATPVDYDKFVSLAVTCLRSITWY